MTEEEKKLQEETQTTQQEQPAWESSADEMRKRADELRTYANSPVSVDTSGQRDYVQEFLDSRLAKSQETDQQKTARETQERKARRLAALSDGLVALSNVMGAMGGATPVTQTSLSEAHKKAVDEAMARRKALAKEYETARQNAMTLAMKQNEANIKRRQAEEKARRDAAKQADTLMVNAATLERLGGNADRNYDLSVDKFGETKRHNNATETDADVRNSISSSRESRLTANGSGGKNQADWDEYAKWKELYPQEVEKIRSDNAQIDILGRPTKSVTTNIVRLTNAAMRRKYGAQSKGTTSSSSGQQKKTDLRRNARQGGGNTSGKKKSAI